MRLSLDFTVVFFRDFDELLNIIVGEVSVLATVSVLLWIVSPGFQSWFEALVVPLSTRLINARQINLTGTSWHKTQDA